MPITTPFARLVCRAASVAFLACSLSIAASPPCTADEGDPAVDLKPKVSGYIQIDYRRALDPPDSLAAHELAGRRARLGITGQLAEGIRYALTVQGDGLDPSTASVVDAYVDFVAAPWVTVRAGQAKYDFDVEAREGDTQIPLMDRPFITNAVAGSLDGRSTASAQLAVARDRGVQAVGAATTGAMHWTYGVGLYQGAGRTADNNSDFSATGRVSVEPVAGFAVGSGFIVSPSQPAGIAGSNDYSAWTASASWDRGRAFARAEWYGARRDFGATAEAIDGFYALADWTTLPKLDVIARWQQIRDGQFAPGSDQLQSFDFGARWFFARKARRAGTFLDFNAMFRSADDGFNQGVTLLNDGRGAPLARGADVGTVLMARVQADF